MKYCLSFILLSIISSVAYCDNLVDKLQNISVTIKTENATGSGVLFTRQDKDNVRTFIITAGHVIDDARHTREVIISGDKKTIVEFKNISVIKEYREDGRRIGESRFDSKVLKYSHAEDGDDLAVLEVIKKDFVSADTTAELYVGDIPQLGTELYHVGSMFGEANSLTFGILSQVGRILDVGTQGKIFDQIECTASGGSSGGGVFLKSDGRLVGILVRGARTADGFNFMVPARRITEWAKKSGVEWVINKNIELPTQDKLENLPVEDTHSIKLNNDNNVDIHKYPYLININLNTTKLRPYYYQRIEAGP